MGFFQIILGGVFSRFDLWKAEVITEHSINLDHPNEFHIKVDFKVDKGQIRKVDSMWYTVAIISESFKYDGAGKCPVWDTLKSRRNPMQQAFHLGEIVVEWTTSTGKKDEHKFSGFNGYDFRSADKYGLIIGRFLVHKSKVEERPEVTVKVTKVDTLLSSLLKEPKIGIYRGGGK